MSIHDREYYKREMSLRAGRPLTFDEKMSASAARASGAKPSKTHYPVMGSIFRHSDEIPKNEPSPVKTAIWTVVALALLAVALRYLL